MFVLLIVLHAATLAGRAAIARVIARVAGRATAWRATPRYRVTVWGVPVPATS